ncbi:MAG: tetratricopeptide repeat protein [Bacteroidota bacterium]
MFPAALESYQSVLKIGEEYNTKSLIVSSYIGIGNLYGMSGDFAKSLEYYLKSLKLIEGDKSQEHLLANTLNNIGNIYKATSDYPKALDSYERALKLNEKFGNQFNIANNLGNLGTVYELLGNYQKALEYDMKSLAIFQSSGNKIGIANNLGNITMVYTRLSEYSKAIEYGQKSLQLFEEMGHKAGVAYLLGNLGSVYASLSDYPRALEYFQRALKIEQDIGDQTMISQNYGNIGEIYSTLANYSEALIYYNKALELDKKMGDEYDIASDLTNIGTIYQSLGNHSKSIEYFEESLKMRQKLDVPDALNLSNIGQVYIDMLEYKKGYEYLKKSLAISEASGEKAITADNYNGMGIVYANIPDSSFSGSDLTSGKNYLKAIELFKLGLDFGLKNNLLDIQRNSWENLSNVYEKKKDYSKSIEAYKNFISIRDSMLNGEKKKQITRLEIQYEFSKKEDSLNLQQQITAGKLQQQVLLAKQQDQQLALNKNQLVLSNKEKDIQKLAYLKTQADLQNEQLLKQEKEKQLTIAEKEKQLQSVQVTTLSQENDLSKLRRRQQWLYSLAVFVLLGLVVSYFFYNNRLKQGKLKMELAKEKAEQEKKEAEFQRNLADVSLTALRSQMNPHFIFNCLNSIKLYTTQNDTVSASEYLTKFSRLIRLVMENSRNDRISLTAELEALRLYIEMEAMRFKEKLSYSISVDKDVEMDYIEIPPLLLQPYVENAVWHGLMHKEEGGRIDISAGMKKNESLLEINIADNGVGRVKSDELKSKTATRHKSYGMKVTSERIALINQIYKTGASVAIHDITNDKGEVAGTRVVIQIPV